MLSWAFIQKNFLTILSGLPLTLFLSGASTAAGIVIGLALAYCRIKRPPAAEPVARVCVSFGRSVPLIVVLYLLHTALPLAVNSGRTAADGALTGADYFHVPAQLTAILAFSVFSGTYLSEAFRSAYYAVGRKQIEAGLSVGMTEARVLFRIVIPQAFRSCIPNLTNVVIDTIKGTAIVYNVSLFEIMGLANLAASRSYRFIEAYLTVLVIYLVVCFTVYFMLKRVEVALYRKY